LLRRARPCPRRLLRLGLVVARDGRVRFDPQAIDALRVGDRLNLGWQPRVAPERFEVIRFNRTSESGQWWQLQSLDRDLVVATLAQRDGLVAGWMQEPGDGGGMEWTLVPIGPGLGRPEPKAADLPGCGGGIGPDVGAEGPLDEGGIAGEDPEECAGCAATVADIAFFYTSLCLEAEEERIENDGGDPEDAPAAIGAVGRCMSGLSNGTNSLTVCWVRFRIPVTASSMKFMKSVMKSAPTRARWSR
jgi:hypothetical protein